MKDTPLLEAFIDGVVNTTMEDAHIAGAVVSVMVDGEVTIKKGYGYSNVAEKRPIDPDKTMFRIGSVTKLFTYMSMMQLHEQGKLDLNANIQDYLPNLEIPDTFPEPIKVINLFTHTAGFEDRVIGLFSYDEASLLPLSEVLGNNLPARVRPPGQVSSYSNHSLGIAGLIIENISEMSWAAYVRKNILNPLGMEYATAFQPVPDALKQHSSVRIPLGKRYYTKQGFELVPLGPAGTMSASAGGSFYKLDTIGTRAFHLGLLTFRLLLMLWALIAWPVQRFTTSRQSSTAESRSRRAYWCFSAITLFIILGIAANSSETIVLGASDSLIFFVNLAYLIPLLSLLTVVAAVRLATDTGTEVRIRTFHIAMGISSIALVWMFNYWNLIGF